MKTFSCYLLTMVFFVLNFDCCIGQSKSISKPKLQASPSNIVKPDTTIYPEPYDFIELDNNPEEGFFRTVFYKNILHKVQYPKEDIENRVFGDVSCRVLIDTNGSPLQSFVLDSPSNSLFLSVQQAISKSVFPIGYFQKKPKLYWMNVRVSFPLALLLQLRYNYESIGKFANGYAEVRRNSKIGLVDSVANEIITPQYDGIHIDAQYFYTLNNGKIGIHKKNGEMLFSPKYDTISSFRNGYAAVAISKNWGPYWGVIDTSGREILPCRYYHILGYPDYFSQGFEAVRDQYGKYGYVNTRGQEITKRHYEQTLGFWNGFAPVGINFKWIKRSDGSIIQGIGQWGFIDTNGTETIPLWYDEVQYFQDGVAQVKKNGKYGLVNKLGKEIVPVQYDSIFRKDLAQGFIWIMQNGKYGIISYRSSKEIVPVQSISLKDAVAFLRVQFKNKFEHLSIAQKNTSLHVLYDSISGFVDGYALAQKGTGWGAQCGIIDSTGQEIIPCRYYSIAAYPRFFNNGCLAVMNTEGKWGFINNKGEEIVAPGKYESTWWFSEGLAAVGNNIEWKKQPNGSMIQGNGRWGFVDTTGREVIPLRFEEAQSFYDGLARVKMKGKYGMINSQGVEVIPHRYDDIFFEGIDNGFARVRIGSKYGILDYRNRKEVIPVDFDSDGDAMKEAAKRGIIK